MYFQFLIEDRSTEILVHHIMKKIQRLYPDKEILYDSKAFAGIGHLRTTGNVMERKGGNLLNNLQMYLKAFDKTLRNMGNQAAIIVVLDNDQREPEEFRRQLEQVAINSLLLTHYIYAIAVKEMEAWLLGDEEAIWQAYPNARRGYLKEYQQDTICDTWQVLANMLYSDGLKHLQKKAGSKYTEIGKMKCEWADKIGEFLNVKQNKSPSFQYFITELEKQIELA